MITLILPFHGFMKSRIGVSLLYNIGGNMSLKDQLKGRYESSYESS